MTERVMEREGPSAAGQAPAGGASACRGDQWQRRGDVPLLRRQPSRVLPVAAMLEKECLDSLEDRSSAPMYRPNATQPEAVGKGIRVCAASSLRAACGSRH